MVVGFYIIIGLIVYSILSIIVVVIGVTVARKHGKSGWKAGALMAVLMYLILFWDLIPMRMTYSYLCNQQAGLQIHKEFDQWKKENPGVADTLVPEQDSASTKVGNKRSVSLNQRFNREIITTEYQFDIRKYDNRIVDKINGDILVQYIDFDAKRNPDNPKSLSDFKPWRYSKSCEADGKKLIEDCLVSLRI